MTNKQKKKQYYAQILETQETLNPCTPSPCGRNAICQEQNGAGACTCLPDYVGDPYDGCRPECTLNSDCLTSLACVRNKCQNPCPGTCGQYAECQVTNHLPSCSCLPGYTGNPFQYCRPQPKLRKSKMKETICLDLLQFFHLHIKHG